MSIDKLVEKKERVNFPYNSVSVLFSEASYRLNSLHSKSLLMKLLSLI